MKNSDKSSLLKSTPPGSKEPPAADGDLIEQTVKLVAPRADGAVQRRTRAAHFVVSVDSPERPVRVDPDAPVVIGRSAGSGLQLEDRSVSGRHCLLTLRDQKLWVEDLGSTNGSLVDGRRIKE